MNTEERSTSSWGRTRSVAPEESVVPSRGREHQSYRSHTSRSLSPEPQHPSSPSSESDEDDTMSAPTSSNKRHREPETSEELVFVKVAKTSGKLRPKASDYDAVAQEIINLANSFYRCLISVRNAFPDPATELAYTKEAWEFAHKKVGLPLRRLDMDIGKVVCNL